MECVETAESGTGRVSESASSTGASERDPGEGFERELGVGIDVYAEEDAVEWDRENDKARADPPHQELREASFGPQEPGA